MTDERDNLLRVSYISSEASDDYCCCAFLSKIFECFSRYWDDVDAAPTLSQGPDKNKKLAKFNTFPKEIIRHIGYFLDPQSIFRVAQTSKRNAKIFDDSFWKIYVQNLRLPRRSSLWERSLPSNSRIEFFAHLLYRKGLLHQAARLGHPEAVIFEKYGIALASNQYLAPEKVIRYRNSSVDWPRTDTLKNAIQEEEKKYLEKINQKYLKIGIKPEGWAFENEYYAC